MSGKWANGLYTVKHPEKYVGNTVPRYRSSWEAHFFRFLDEHPAVLQWASESIRIPYRNPLTGKVSSYIPDILMVYLSANDQKVVELIEIKPSSQSSISEAKGLVDKAQAIINTAKWEAARAWCRQQGIVFRVVTEKDLFVSTRARKPRRPKPKKVSNVRSKQKT